MELQMYPPLNLLYRQLLDLYSSMFNSATQTCPVDLLGHDLVIFSFFIS